MAGNMCASVAAVKHCGAWPSPNRYRAASGDYLVVREERGLSAI